MTEQEQQERLMYQIIGKITDANAPIVFKGALITKLILKENGYSEIERQTNDIDANWVGEPPTMDDLASVINHSLTSFSTAMYAEPERIYAPGKINYKTDSYQDTDHKPVRQNSDPVRIWRHLGSHSKKPEKSGFLS